MKLTAWPGAALTISCWLPLTRRMSFFIHGWKSDHLGRRLPFRRLHQRSIHHVLMAPALPALAFIWRQSGVCGSLFFCHLWEGGAHFNGALCAAVALETVHGSFNVYPYFAATVFLNFYSQLVYIFNSNYSLQTCMQRLSLISSSSSKEKWSNLCSHLLCLCFTAVLDMARHVPLYRALLELLRAISTCTSLVPLLLPLSGDPGREQEEEDEQAEGHTSVGMLLAKMKTCVDTYTSRLRWGFVVIYLSSDVHCAASVPLLYCSASVFRDLCGCERQSQRHWIAAANKHETML